MSCDCHKKLYAQYPSPNIIQMIKTRRLRRAEHVAGQRERRGAYRGKPEGRKYLKDPCADGRIILKRILEKCDEGHELDRCGS